MLRDDVQLWPTLPALDLDRARQFYSTRLGLDPTREVSGGLIYEYGPGNSFLLYPSSGAASGAHTQAAWLVSDIEVVVSELRARGVVFEDYDAPGLKTVDGIADLGYERSAWFKDSEGNLLAVGQLTLATS